MTKTCVALFIFAPLMVYAQTECAKISDDKDRLACFDKAFDVKPTATKFQGRPSIAAQRIKLRSDGAWDNIGKDPASLSISRVNGEDASQIKAAVVVLGPAFDNGWQPFASYGINRNTLTKDKADVRAVTAGLSGSVFDYVDTGVSLWTTVSAAYRENKIDDTQSALARVDTFVAIRGLADGTPFPAGSNDFRLLPRFGFQFEDQHKVKQGAVAGNARGGFVGLRFDYWPGSISERLQFTAQTLRYRDFTVEALMTKRDTSYHKAGIDYYLYHPNDKSVWLLPVISLEREVGEDPVFGIPKAGRTQLSFKLKIN